MGIELVVCRLMYAHDERRKPRSRTGSIDAWLDVSVHEIQDAIQREMVLAPGIACKSPSMLFDVGLISGEHVLEVAHVRLV